MASMNDAITGGSAQTGSTAEQYYRWMLMKEKLDLRGSASGASAEAKEILGTYTEEEKIRENVLKKCLAIKESSAEYDQMVALAGGQTDRFKIADIIATAVWEKTLAKQKLSMFAPTKKELETIYETSERDAIKVRLNRGQKIDDASTKSALSKLVIGFFPAGTISY
jgi:hypothetical protein